MFSPWDGVLGRVLQPPVEKTGQKGTTFFQQTVPTRNTLNLDHVEISSKECKTRCSTKIHFLNLVFLYFCFLKREGPLKAVIQEYPEDAIKIEGRAVLVQVYVLVTSASPLRVYRYRKDGHVLLQSNQQVCTIVWLIFYVQYWLIVARWLLIPVLKIMAS